MRRVASILTVAALVIASFFRGWWARGTRPAEGPEVCVRIDTGYYERPQLTASCSRPVTVGVPRLLFAPPAVVDSATTESGVHCANNAQCPGSCSENPTASADSVAMVLEIETRVYEDSLYRAQVTGPAVGGYHPTLDWVETYNRTQTITRTQRHRFAVTAGVGAAYTPRGIQPTVGVQVGVVLWGF